MVAQQAGRNVGVPSKFVPTLPPRHLVRRNRLESLLDTPTDVVLVTAAAGYGKTALVSGWIAARPERQVAWISVDALDSTEATFWIGVSDALAVIVPAAAEAGDLIAEQGLADRHHIAALSHALWSHDGVIDLVLDDAHLLAPLDVAADLELLVERCRGHLRLIVTGRAPLRLPIARWLTEGRLVEIDEAALAFRDDEAAELLSPYAATAARAAELTDEAEGWAVGMLLNAIAAASAPNDGPVAVRNGPHLTAYLVREVLDQLPPAVQQLAWDASVMPWFDAELLVDSGLAHVDTLEAFLEANPFVVQLAPRVWRLHHLVSATLRSEYRWRQRDRHDDACRRVAAALAERGAITEAIDLLLGVGAVDEAVDLIIGPALEFNDRGQLRSFRRWFDRLPAVAPGDLQRTAAYSLACLLAGRTSDAVRWANRMPVLAEAHGDSSGLAVTSLAAALGADGRLLEAESMLGALRAAGADEPGSARIDGRRSSMAARLLLALGRPEEAAPWIEQIRTARHDVLGQLHAPTLQAWSAALHGDAVRSAEFARVALEVADAQGARPHPATFEADIADARAHTAMLAMEAAGRAVDRLAGDADVLDWPWCSFLRWPVFVDFRALEQGWGAAAALAESLPVGLSDDVEQLRRRLLVRCLIGAGRFAEAERRVSGLEPGASRILLEARLRARSGDWRRVDEMLPDDAEVLTPARIESLLVRAGVPGRPDADALLDEALALAEPGAWWSPFVLEGSGIDVLLRRRRSRLAAIDDFHRRRTSVTNGSLPDGEALSVRELEVLALLPTHLSYAEIGAELYISVNTVKTHLGSIYRKLGATSRSEAVRLSAHPR